MAQHTYVTIHAIDGKSKATRFSYEAKDNNPSDSKVKKLVDQWKKLTNLGVKKVTVHRTIDSIAATPAVDLSARIGDTANLRCHKGQDYGGTYTFELVAVKDGLVNPDGTLKVTDSNFSKWCELFDDGTGLFGVAGDFTLSDGEALAENGSGPTQPSGYTQISGKLDGKR